MKFAEGLVSSLLLSLPPSRLPVPPSPRPLCPARTLTSWSLYHPLQVPFQPPPSLPLPPALPATTNYPVTTESRISPTCFKWYLLKIGSIATWVFACSSYTFRVPLLPSSPPLTYNVYVRMCIRMRLYVSGVCARTWRSSSMDVHEDVSSSKFRCRIE